MGRLTDILRNGQAERLRAAWGTTEAAGELAPLPPGEYIAHIVAGQLENSKTNATPGYKLTFRVCEGQFTGRQFWHDVWLTEAALSMAKRDLAKLGVTSLEQLEQPLPRGIRCACKLVRRTGDDGAEYNRLRSFVVVGIDEPEADAFAPTNEPDAGPRLGDAAELDAATMARHGQGEVAGVPF
ncbi:MAG: hypothetical protein KJ000_34350 [Pirellulaceae bacterium]|nr:hypothetical protein [Pirellulaceae bacterium]